MMNIVDKMLVATISFVVIFSALLLIPKQNHNLAYILPLPEPEKKQQPSSKEGVKNAKAMTLPGVFAYKIIDGKAQKLIKLKEVGLTCVILKDLRIDKKRYYLIQLTGKAYRLSKWIVREKDVILLPEPLEWTDSGDKAL